MKTVTLVAFEDWVRESLNKPVYVVGPLLPPGYDTEPDQITTTTKPGDLEIGSFLDSMRSITTESVLLISFGTVFWPKLEGQLEALVDALIDPVLCHPSPLAIMPGTLLETTKTSGIDMTATWAQQYILSHPATGYFLTHCGHGGTFDALSRGIPMICWPFEADQPIVAVHVSQNLNVAFHLMEVRTGKGLQPLHDGYDPQGTRAAMQVEFREMGKKKGRNAQKMQVLGIILNVGFPNTESGGGFYSSSLARLAVPKFGADTPSLCDKTDIWMTGKPSIHISDTRRLEQKYWQTIRAKKHRKRQYLPERLCCIFYQSTTRMCRSRIVARECLPYAGHGTTGITA
ncbi:hypothetical protein DFH08DRAFT_941348 [Mycena albidolilacea]|uniref:Glycosyltransferase family 1 protein n=1 Tax=Mycena albidolilacea TaxID=1033008 RepID=A0AAD6ZIK6_9AGAR|nr:hypothetical protein DFH08DRAFT_941348 [Mycena albidolilacea]